MREAFEAALELLCVTPHRKGARGDALGEPFFRHGSIVQERGIEIVDTATGGILWVVEDPEEIQRFIRLLCVEQWTLARGTPSGRKGALSYVLYVLNTVKWSGAESVTTLSEIAQITPHRSGRVVSAAIGPSIFDFEAPQEVICALDVWTKLGQPLQADCS